MYATETEDSGSIPRRVKPKTIKLVFTASLLDVQQLKEQREASIVCGKQVGRWQLDLKTERFLSLSPAQGKLVNKMHLQLQFTSHYIIF